MARRRRTGPDGARAASSRGVLLSGLAVVSLVSALAAWFHAARIEDAISQRVLTEVVRTGLRQADVTVDGRDVILNGTVRSDADRRTLVEAAAVIKGVRRVVDARTVATPDPSHRFIINAFAGIVSVQGRLPSRAAVERVSREIREAWGSEPLTSSLVVDPAAVPPVWLPRLAELASAIRVIEPVTLESAGLRVTLLGTVRSEAEADALGGRVRAILGDDHQVEFRFQIAPRQGPWLVIHRDGGALEISGQVADQAARADLERLVRGSIGIEASGALELEAGIAAAPWQSTVAQLLPLVAALPRWRIEANLEHVAVAATVDNNGQRDRLAAGLQRILSAVPVLSTIEVAVPGPSADGGARHPASDAFAAILPPAAAGRKPGEVAEGVPIPAASVRTAS